MFVNEILNTIEQHAYYPRKALSMKTALLIGLLLIFMPTTAVSEEDTLDIGVLLPLSGELASIGNAVSNGIALASEQYPDGFEKLNFVYDDSRYDAKATLSSFARLKQRTQKTLVFIWGSPTCMAVAPVAERERRPLVCFSGDPKPGLQYVFSFNNPAEDYAAKMAEYIHSMTYSSVALVYSEIQFYGSLADALEERIKKDGQISVYRESVVPSTQDFSTLVSKLKAGQQQALALFLLPHQIPTFSRQMAALNYRPAIIGADTFSDVEAIENSKGVLDEAVYVDMRVDPAFATAYTNKYGNRSNLTLAYNGYRFALMLLDIFADKMTSTEELLKRLRNYSALVTDETRAINFKQSDTFGQYFSFPIELKQVGVADSS